MKVYELFEVSQPEEFNPVDVRPDGQEISYYDKPKSKKDSHIISEVIATLKGKRSEIATKMALRFKKMYQIKKQIEKEADELRDLQYEQFAKYFTEEDQAFTNVIETASMIMKRSKSSPATTKSIEKMDWDGFLDEVFVVFPHMEKQLIEIKEKFMDVQVKDVPPTTPRILQPKFIDESSDDPDFDRIVRKNDQISKYLKKLGKKWNIVLTEAAEPKPLDNTSIVKLQAVEFRYDGEGKWRRASDNATVPDSSEQHGLLMGLKGFKPDGVTPLEPKTASFLARSVNKLIGGPLGQASRNDPNAKILGKILGTIGDGVGRSGVALAKAMGFGKIKPEPQDQTQDQDQTEPQDQTQDQTEPVQADPGEKSIVPPIIKDKKDAKAATDAKDAKMQAQSQAFDFTDATSGLVNMQYKKKESADMVRQAAQELRDKNEELTTKNIIATALKNKGK